MDVADAEEYTQALGQVVAGGWRQIALGERLGVPAALGLTTRDWVDQRLGGYVRLSIPERREAVAELVNGEGMTQRQAADVLGVSQPTVSADVRSELIEPAAAEPKKPTESSEVIAERMARLDKNLVARVRDGSLSLDEAETVHAQNERQVDAWAKRVRDGLTVLVRMVGHPIPGGIRSRLTDNEGAELVAVLDALRPFKETT